MHQCAAAQCHNNPEMEADVLKSAVAQHKSPSAAFEANIGLSKRSLLYLYETSQPFA